jgi:hypothetical protein
MPALSIYRQPWYRTPRRRSRRYGVRATHDTISPTLVSASISTDGLTLTLVFSEPVSGLDDSQFTIVGGDYSITGPAGSGTTWSFDIGMAVQNGDSLTLTYSGGGVVVDGAGNSLADFSGQSITNNVPDTTPPTLASDPVIDSTGSTLTVPFSEDVAGVIANQYNLGGGHTLSSPVGNASGGLHGDAWSFTITPAVAHGETLTIAYAGASTKDSLNNLLATFSGQAVTNNVPLEVPEINADATEGTADATVIGWFAVAGATGYKVERSLDGSAWGTAVVLGNVTTYSDTTTTLDVDYYYRVAATDSTSESAYSDAFGPITGLGPGGTGVAPTDPGIIFGNVIDCVRGDAYLAEDGRQWAFNLSDGDEWPDDLSGHTITFTAKISRSNRATGDLAGDATVTMNGDIAVATGDDRSVYFEPDEDVTATLAIGVGAKGYNWDLVAIKDGHHKTLRRGVMTVRENQTA